MENIHGDIPCKCELKRYAECLEVSFYRNGSLSDLFLKYYVLILIMDFLEQETTNELLSFLTPFNYFPRFTKAPIIRKLHRRNY